MMHPVRKKRLLTAIVLLLCLSIVVALVLYALRQNINLFYTPTQIALQEAPFERQIRMGGLVKANSIQRFADSLVVEFVITDTLNDVLVTYEGILPDLFREEQGMVVQGVLQPEGYFAANQVLAKHDENYMPPEAKEALDRAMLEKLGQ